MSTVIKRLWRRLLTALNHLTGGAAKPLRVASSDTGEHAGEPTLRRDIYLASFVINLLGLGLPLVTLQVYDRIIPHRARETLTFLLIGLAIALVFDLALRTARSALLSWQAMRFVRGIEHEAVTRRSPCAAWSHRTRSRSESTSIALPRLPRSRAITRVPRGLVAIDVPFVFVTLAIIAAVGGFMVLVPITLVLFLRRPRHSPQPRLPQHQRRAQRCRTTISMIFFSDVVGRRS